jgi:hypothetical protein
VPADLKTLQRWFQARTMNGKVADAKREILPSRTLSADERLGVYSGMYVLRLHDALVVDFPTVRAVTGEAGFERLARAYLEKHPSMHPSLNHLGDKLPRFLEGAVRVKRRALLRDIAAVELAMTEVFDAPRSAPLANEALEAVPPDAWPKVRLELVPALRLLALDHAVNPLITAVRREEPLPAARKRRSWIAVYRKDWNVWRMDLSEPMFRVLAAFQKGATLERAIAASGVKDPGVVFAWFQDWRREGLFAGVKLPGARQKRASRGRV